MDQNGDATSPSIENVILIDFQYACWTSPTIDLHYFLNTSLQESLRPGRFNELLAIYHEHLVECLQRFDYKKPIPNLDEFKKQYDDKKFYGKLQKLDYSKIYFNLFFIFRFCCCLFSTTADDQRKRGRCQY